MSSPRIRLAQVVDAAAMPQIEADAATVFSGEADTVELNPSSPRSHEQYAALVRKGRSLVAEEDGRIAGFIACEPFGRELHVWELNVRPEWQRQGIGALLLRAVLVDGRASGFRAVTLTTFRNVPWNAPFYARLGFAEVSDAAANARLATVLAKEVKAGLPADRRMAMIRFLN